MQVFAAWGLDRYQLLSAALQKTRNLTSLPAITKTETGKPYFPQHPHLHFSLSHSGDLTVCALDDNPVGVDAELIYPRSSSLPAYALTENEYDWYKYMGADWPAFYALWTKKEAWCKYRGEGLATLWRKSPPEGGALHYRLFHSELWCITVCGTGVCPEELCWLSDIRSDP